MYEFIMMRLKYVLVSAAGREGGGGAARRRTFRTTECDVETKEFFFSDLLDTFQLQAANHSQRRDLIQFLLFYFLKIYKLL